VSQSDPAAIESDIEATRARLAGTVDELAVRLHPKEIGRRSVQDAKQRVHAATHTSDGSLRTERIAAIAAAAVAVVGLLVAMRRRRSHRDRRR
jgi:MYXO-CTERM domain-containing protein